jgi:P2 family phage major capsid protein
MNLSRQAKAKMDQLIKLTAQKYEGQVGEAYTATPSVAQQLNDKIVEDGNWLLPLINVLPVNEVSGEKILMGLSGPVTSRTDTSGSTERVAKQLVQLDTLGYTLKKTETDVALKYSMIDMWAKFPDFAARYGKAVRQAIGNDRVRVGWRGTSAAATTNVGTNPLLQDVNVGWLEQIRNYNSGSQRIIGTVGAPINLSANAGTSNATTFPNLDSLVHPMEYHLGIPFQDDPDLVILVSRDLMAAAEGRYYAAQSDRPTEKRLIEDNTTVKTYGGFPAIVPPFFPSGTLLLTSLNNLSIYWQGTSWRRQQIDNPRKDQYEDFNSRQEGYVVENFDKCYLIENVTLVA